MKFIYADPPYIGQAKVHYADDPRCSEVNHKELIAQLELTAESWALSLHTNSLKDILPLCPRRARVMAWVKPFATFKRNVNPTYAWEPVILCYGRKRRGRPFVHDWVAASPQMRSVVVGQKPAEFCYWLFEAAGLEPGDEFIDLFPGSGMVLEYWKLWSKRMEIQK